MNRVRIGYESGMHRGAHQVITLSVKLREGGLGARPYVCNLPLSVVALAAQP